MDKITLPSNGWKNKVGTSDRSCGCGSWKQHWINGAGKDQPRYCSVYGCSNQATLGAHIYNSNVESEWIAPLCDSCNKISSEFSLSDGSTVVPTNKNNCC